MNDVPFIILSVSNAVFIVALIIFSVVYLRHRTIGINRPLVYYIKRSMGNRMLPLPKTLFRLYNRYIDLPGDNVNQYWADVIIDKNHFLYIEESSITYSAHNIGHNTGKTTTKKMVSFRQLPKLIAESNDPDAAKYVGMNRMNWKRYIKESKKENKSGRESSKYHTMRFGKFRWYILEKENDTLLLLSKYGIDTRPWNSENRPVDWTKSTLCNWLNCDFIKMHFTRKEQRAFVEFEDGTHVSLLSSDMIERYLKDNSALTVRPNRNALKHGAFSYEDSGNRSDYNIYLGNGFGWLKDTHEKEDTYAYCICWDGSIGIYPFDSTKVVVRPLIKIDKRKLK